MTVFQEAYEELFRHTAPYLEAITLYDHLPVSPDSADWFRGTAERLRRIKLRTKSLKETQMLSPTFERVVDLSITQSVDAEELLRCLPKLLVLQELRVSGFPQVPALASPTHTPQRRVRLPRLTYLRVTGGHHTQRLFFISTLSFALPASVNVTPGDGPQAYFGDLIEREQKLFEQMAAAAQGIFGELDHPELKPADVEIGRVVVRRVDDVIRFCVGPRSAMRAEIPVNDEKAVANPMLGIFKLPAHPIPFEDHRPSFSFSDDFPRWLAQVPDSRSPQDSLMRPLLNLPMGNTTSFATSLVVSKEIWLAISKAAPRLQELAIARDAVVETFFDIFDLQATQRRPFFPNVERLVISDVDLDSAIPLRRISAALGARAEAGRKPIRELRIVHSRGLDLGAVATGLLQAFGVVPSFTECLERVVIPYVLRTPEVLGDEEYADW